MGQADLQKKNIFVKSDTGHGESDLKITLKNISVECVILYQL